jgi:hypothetical protein
VTDCTQTTPGNPACCASQCINLDDSFANCGKCFNPCNTQVTQADGGPPVDPECCAGSCVDLYHDDANCNSCGNNCADEGLSCVFYEVYTVPGSCCGPSATNQCPPP